MPMWDMHNRTTPEQARINRGRSNNGKIPAVEDTTAPDDDYDVNIRLAGSGVVYDSAGSDASAGGTGECSHGGHDRCICGMAGARKGEVDGTATD